MQIQRTYWLEKVLKMISLYVNALLCTPQHIVIHAMQLSGDNSENSCCDFQVVMCPVCRMLQHPANRTHNSQLHTRPATWKPHTKYHRQQPLYNTLELLMMGIVVPGPFEQAIRSAIKTSVASSWHFIFTY